MNAICGTQHVDLVRWNRRIADPGKVRQNNEDHYIITQMGRSFRALATNMPAGELPEPVDDTSYAMVVADGMGGMAAGEKASQLAIRTGVQLVLSSSRWSTKIDEEEARQINIRMREYFHKVDHAIIGEGGTVMQYVGDAVMAVFGAPEPSTDHADRALRAAVAMHAAQLHVNDEWTAQGLPPFHIGTAIK